MEFHFLVIFALFYVVLQGGNASPPAEEYWKSMLPNTPMPKALKDLLLKPADTTNITFSEEDANLNGGARTDYGVGYWSETKKFDKKAIFNTTTIYFFYTDLHPNKKMTLMFSKSTNKSNFLPHKISESIPFSSNKLLEILNHFSINPTSKEARIMNRTIKNCEAPSIEGEVKHCATSLESLVDFVIEKFGKNIQANSNEAEEQNKKQEYTILKGIKMIGDDQIVSHKEMYAYAVFYCHTISDTKGYIVPLMGDDGSKATAAVLCHFNTSAWNSEHFAFQVLKVKPGGPPICHFLNSDTIVFVPN